MRGCESTSVKCALKQLTIALLEDELRRPRPMRRGVAECWNRKRQNAASSESMKQGHDVSFWRRRSPFRTIASQRTASGSAAVLRIAMQSCKIVASQEMPIERHSSAANYRSNHGGDGPQIVAGLTPISTRCEKPHSYFGFRRNYVRPRQPLQAFDSKTHGGIEQNYERRLHERIELGQVADTRLAT
jgi:hypothetical protein